MKRVLIFILVTLLFISPVSAHSVTAYGEMHGHDDTGITVNLIEIDKYENITGLNSSITNQFIYSDLPNSSLIVGVSGVYKLEGTLSFSSTGGGGEYGINALINGSLPLDTNCHAHRTIDTGGAVGSTAINCLLRLNESDIITIGIQDEDSPLRNIVWNAVDLSLHWLSPLDPPPDIGIINLTNINFEDLRFNGGRLRIYYNNGSFIDEIESDGNISYDKRQGINIHFLSTRIDLITESDDISGYLFGYLPFIAVALFIIIILLILLIGSLVFYIRSLRS